MTAVRTVSDISFSEITSIPAEDLTNLVLSPFEESVLAFLAKEAQGVDYRSLYERLTSFQSHGEDADLNFDLHVLLKQGLIDQAQDSLFYPTKLGRLRLFYARAPKYWHSGLQFLKAMNSTHLQCLVTDEDLLKQLGWSTKDFDEVVDFLRDAGYINKNGVVPRVFYLTERSKKLLANIDGQRSNPDPVIKLLFKEIRIRIVRLTQGITDMEA